MAMSLMLAGCSGTVNSDSNGDETKPKGKLTLTVDRNIIKADGNDAAAFTVTFKENGGENKDITKEAEIYFSDSDDLLGSDRFSTKKAGEHTFYAAYGLNISEEVTVSALSVIPEIPADPNEGATAFKHRILIIQHTGATCPNCPLMMNSLKTLSENAEYNTAYHLVASHSYNDGLNDKAYSSAAKTISAMFNDQSYPSLTFNLTNTNTGHNYNDICNQIDALRQESAHAGASASVAAADGEIIVNAEFKFAEDGTYRIGAWLLEDGIFATQHGATENWHHTHNNALRAMYGDKQTESIYGRALGEVKAGTKSDALFRFTLEDGWKAENCKVLIFITEARKNGAETIYDIVNCTVCKAGESTAYEYR